MDLTRARLLMAETGIDALLVIGPENVAYVTGAPIGPAHMWRRFGPYLALIPAADAPTAALVADSHERAVREAGVIDEVRSHRIWIEYADVTGEPSGDIRDRLRRAAGDRRDLRPETFDLAVVARELAALVGDLGLSTARLGVEFEQLPLADERVLRETLPQATLVDSSHLFRRLRLIKSEREIDLLRTAVALTEEGIRAAAAAALPGAPIREVALNFRRGVLDAATRRGVPNLTGSWDILSVGDRPWSAPAKDHIAPGDLIKFDCGAIVGGMQADIGRTFVVGPASATQRAIHDALRAGMAAALETLRVGTPLSAVFAAAERTVHQAGFDTYIRGHYGHSLGFGPGNEEWPWIGRAEEYVVEPNTVFAVETPYYIDGVGGFMLEHNVVVREDGIEVLDQLSDALVEIA